MPHGMRGFLENFGVETIADLDLLREDDLADIPAVSSTQDPRSITGHKSRLHFARGFAGHLGMGSS